MSSSNSIEVKSDVGGSASSTILQYPFVMHIGYNIYSMDMTGKVTFVKRADMAASGCKLSMFCYPPGSPNLELGVRDPDTVKLKGYIVTRQDVDSDILSFTRS